MPEAPLAGERSSLIFLQGRRSPERLALLGPRYCFGRTAWPVSSFGSAAIILWDSSSTGKHVIRAIDGVGFGLIVLLNVDAEVRDVLVVVLRFRLLVRDADSFLRRIVWHAEDGVRIERFFHGPADGGGLTRSRRLVRSPPPRVLF